MKNRSYYIYILLFNFLYFNSAFAAEGEQQAGNITSAGTVVVAAMESVGYHAQNQILTSLNTMIGDLGGLIYLGVLVSATLTVALMGRYQAALWILMGPPLFIYVSGVELGGQKNRISAKGPDWQMGAFKGPEGKKEELMRRQDSATEVSFVFHKYNELISEIYQLLINKITSEDARKPILFMARQRAVEELFSFDVTSPGSKALGAFFFGHCSNYIGYARTLAQGKRSVSYRQSSVYKDAGEKYCKGFDFPNINLGNESVVLADYAKGLEPTYKLGENVSCLQIWNYFRQSASRDFGNQAEWASDTIIGVEAASTKGAETHAKMWDDVLDKITTQRKATAPSSEPCPFPSDSASFAIDSGTTTSLRVLANIYSAMQIRKNNTVDANASGFMSVMGGDMSNVFPSSDGSSKREVIGIQGRETVLRAQNAKVLGKAKQFEAFSLLMLIPYFQGMILYALSVSYPFFALTILIPGQAGSFFNWLALWAWAKSWDVGFAMIMVVDQLLWEILPQTTFFEKDAIGEYTPVDLLAMHYEGDYSYSVSMYWLIVSALIGAVPVVTAEAILGSKKAVAGAIMGGFSDIGGRMSKAVEDYHATKGVSAIVLARTQGEANEVRAMSDQTRSKIQAIHNKASGSDSSTGDPLGTAKATASSQAGAAANIGKAGTGIGTPTDNVVKDNVDKLGEDSNRNRNGELIGTPPEN